MTEEDLHARVISITQADMLKDPRASRTYVKSQAVSISLDIATGCAVKYLSELIQIKEEMSKRSLKDQFAAHTAKENEKEIKRLADEIDRLREERTKLVHDLASTHSDLQCIVNKVQRLQPGGSPPPGGSPVVLVYWIVDTMLDKQMASFVKTGVQQA